VDPEQDERELYDDAGEFIAEDDDESGTPLGSFATDRSVPVMLAERARVWQDSIHYGLWLLDDLTATPGIWCTEILSATRRYVEFPAVAVGGLARWTVWLGGIVPVDGIWRGTGAGMRLSPAEADAAAEFVHVAAIKVTMASAGNRDSELPPPALRVGMADPCGVYANDEDPAAPQVAALMSQLTCAVMTRIAADIGRYRTAPPRLQSTDGDPMCLITATVKLGAPVASLLAAHPDFEQDEDHPDTMKWWGLEIRRRNATRCSPRSWLSYAPKGTPMLTSSGQPARSAGCVAPSGSVTASWSRMSTRGPGSTVCWRCSPS
jgi:hypothetical protein